MEHSERTTVEFVALHNKVFGEAIKEAKRRTRMWGVITLLALNEFSYEIPGLQPMPAEPRIDRKFLVGAKFWKMDQSNQRHILQRHKDDFPVLDPQNTYVCGHYYRDNWLMNTPEHRFIVESRLHGPWTSKWEYPNIPSEMPIPVLPP